MPVFVKSNMATDPDLNMSTSFGACAFGNAKADHDVFMVARAREASSINMGKKNPGGLIGFKNKPSAPDGRRQEEKPGPYMMARLVHRGLMKAWPTYHKHPCGSSGGSAVAVVAGFSPLAFGRETQGLVDFLAYFIAL